MCQLINRMNKNHGIYLMRFFSTIPINKYIIKWVIFRKTDVTRDNYTKRNKAD